MGLHVPGVRDAWRRFDILVGVGHAESGPFIVFVEVNQFVIGPRMQRIEPQQRLVVGHCGHRTAEQTRTARQLSAVVPALLVIVVQGQQVINRQNRRLAPRLGIADAGQHAFFLQPRRDEQVFAMAAARQQACAFFSASAWLPLPYRSRPRLRPHQAIAQSGSYLAAVSKLRAALCQT